MKNKKSLRILIAALAFAILTVALCFAAFAEETPELSVKILAKNVAYDEVVKVLFAVDDTAAGGNEVEVIYYVEDPTVNTQAKAYAGIKYEVGYTDKNGTPDDTSDDVKYPAFFTAGFPAANIGDNVYARAHIVGTDVYSDVVRYSVVEYLLERLYQDKAEGDKKALYETLLDYGEYSQKVILNGDADPDNDVERFVTEYVLVTMSEGGIDETPDNKRDASYPTGIYFVGDKIYPTSKEVKSWKVTVGDTSKVVNNAAEVVVSGFTTITVNEYANAAPTYKPDLNDTEGRETFEGEEVINADPWAPEGGKAEIVDGAPYGEDSKVYYLGSNNKSTQEVSFRVDAKDEDANVIWFESDMMILPYSTGNVEIHIRSKTNAGYIFYFGLDPDGNVVLKDKNTTAIATLAPAGEWFRFGFKYATQDDGKAALAFYYNEERVAASADLEGAFTVEQLIADTGSPRIRVRFMSWSATVCDHYFDNVKLDVIKSDDYAITVDPTVPDPDQPGEGGEGGEDGPTVPTNPVDPTYKPDLTDTAGRETYDDNNLTDVFTQYDLWIDGAAAGSKIEIADGKPYGTDSKVYYYHTVAGFKPEINMKFNVVSGANAARFETDLMLDPDVADNIQFIFGSGSVGVNCFWFESTEEGDIYLLAKDESRIAKVAVAGEWFRLTVEYLEYEDGTRAFKFYVNEKRVGEGRVFAGDQAISQFQKFRVWSEPDYVGDIYFDNTKVEFYTHTEEPEIPTTPEEPEELEPVHPNYKPDLTDTEGRETYEDNDLTDVFVKFDNWHDGQGEGAYVIDDGTPYGESSKVYHYSAAEGYKPEVSMVFNPVAGTNAVRFETDIMFKPVTANKIQFILGSGSTGVNCFYFTSDADGYIYLLAKDETEIAKVAIAGEWFRFAVEYLEFEGSVYEFRFFINDERVGADKVFAGEQAVSSVKKLRFWSEKTYIGEIFFDNSKVDIYTHSEIPTTPEEPEELEPVHPNYKPDLTDTEGRETYEDNDLTDVFVKFDNWHDGQGEGAYVIDDGTPYGESSKVYHYSAAEGYKPEVSMVFNPVAGTNAVRFETDIMFKPVTANKIQFILGSGSTGVNCFYFTSDADGYIYLLAKDETEIAKVAIAGEWFRFAVEYLEFEGSVYEFRFFINDERVGADKVFAGEQAVSSVKKLRFWSEKTYIGEIFFDNSKVELYTHEEELEDPYVPDFSDLATRETYEDGDALDQFKWNSWHGNQGDSAYGIVDGKPYGIDSKVYNLNTADGYKPEIAFEWTKVSTNVVAYETDMMITTTGTLTPEISLRENGSTAIFVFYMRTKGDKVELLDSGNQVIATIADDGEWFRFRIEYIDGTDGTATVKFYINDVQLPETCTATGSASAIGRVKFWTQSTHVGNVYFDNTKIEFEAFKAPETDGSDDTEVTYKPDLTDTEGRETYEDGDSLDTFKFDNGATTEIVSDAPYGEASKVYKYIKTDNSKVNEINIKPLSKPTGTNTFIFESDIKFVANSAATIEIQIRGNSSVGIGYTLFLSVTDDGDVVIKDQSNSAIATIAKAGEWFRLGIGYGTTAEGSGVLLYVNGEQINEAPLAASKNVADFDRIRFMGHTASVFDFYLDNTKAQYIVK